MIWTDYIPALLVLIYLISLPFTFGKPGLQSPFAKILTCSPIVLIFFDSHLAFNIIYIGIISTCYILSVTSENTKSQKITLLVMYTICAILFLFNNSYIFFP